MKNYWNKIIFVVLFVIFSGVVSAVELNIDVCDVAYNGPFSLNINNEWLPFPVGMVNVIEDSSTKVQISVLDQTEVVDGVVTRVVEEREWVNNVLVEVSRNFFVQSPEGYVCYYGEDVDIYDENGNIIGHSGAWRAGVGQNRAGIMMPPNPQVGMTYYMEYAPGIVMETAHITSLGDTVVTPAGTFTDTVYIVETSPGASNSYKYYARGIGMIYDDGMKLTSYSGTTTTSTSTTTTIVGGISPDTNGDGCVDLNEIINYINLWKQGQVTLQEVINAVQWWKQGCGTTTTTIGTTTTTSSTTTTSIPGQGFRFIAWADSRGGFSKLNQMSDQIFTLSGPAPSLTIFPGDLESSGFSSVTQNQWKPAINGNLNGGPSNGLFDKTFATRGNHDDANTGGWQSFFNFQQHANNIGATHYTEMSGATDLTYSFDYGNSHFVGIDMTGGDVDSISSSQINWLNSDLAAAESRGLQHAFIFFHGPIYAIGGHCCPSAPSGLINVLNSHPIVSATFHGHEHEYAYVHIDSSRISSITQPFEEFVVGNAGAPGYSCQSGRSDFCYRGDGFTVLDVSGNQLTVKAYKLGSNSPIHTITYTN